MTQQEIKELYEKFDTYRYNLIEQHNKDTIKLYDEIKRLTKEHEDLKKKLDEIK